MIFLRIMGIVGWFLLEILMNGVPSSKKTSFYDASYFPVKEGMQWEYRVTEDGHTDIQQVVCDVLDDDTNGGILFELQNSGTRNSCYRYRLLNDSIYHLETRVTISFFDYTFVNQPKLPVFCFPVSAGSAWQMPVHVESTFYDKSVLADFTVLPEENVSTPAGSWSCMKLQIDLQENARHRIAYAFYARGIGLVKVVSPEYQKELIRFTL